MLKSQQRYQGLLANRGGREVGALAARSASCGQVLTAEELTASIMPAPAKPPDGVELKVGAGGGGPSRWQRCVRGWRVARNQHGGPLRKHREAPMVLTFLTRGPGNSWRLHACIVCTGFVTACSLVGDEGQPTRLVVTTVCSLPSTAR